MNSDKRDKSGTFTGKHADVTEKIIQAFYTVYNQLGPLMRDGLKEVAEGNVEFPANGVYSP